MSDKFGKYVGMAVRKIRKFFGSVQERFGKSFWWAVRKSASLLWIGPQKIGKCFHRQKLAEFLVLVDWQTGCVVRRAGDSPKDE